MKLRSIEIVADKTAESRCDEGFLRVSRLELRNHYTDGTSSESYPCDVVSRARVDAVVCVLYAIREGRVQVILRESARPPIYLRRFKELEHPDEREYTTLREVVAGLLEPEDAAGELGLKQRGAIEAEEEAGFRVSVDELEILGQETFASPGTADEKVFYVAGPVDLEVRGEALGDGSVMEEASELHVMELGAAIAACRMGEIPDMKTELALCRLADHLGYLPQLGCFASDLPEPLRFEAPGLPGLEGRDA